MNGRVRRKMGERRKMKDEILQMAQDGRERMEEEKWSGIEEEISKMEESRGRQ